jgi:hypothetical protein
MCFTIFYDLIKILELKYKSFSRAGDAPPAPANPFVGAAEPQPVPINNFQIYYANSNNYGK